MSKLQNIIVCLLAIVGVVSCRIKEDMSKCPGTILLDYTAYSDEVIAEIAPEEEVSVYVFDKNGICCDIITHTYGDLEAIDFEFKVPILYNGLQAVVWHGNDSEDYYNPQMALGQSYEDFSLSLNKEISKNVFTHLTPSLWASPLEPIDYCASKTRHRIHMTRIHTRVNVNLKMKLDDGSFKDINMDDYLVKILSPNDVYHTDYTLCEECEMTEFNNQEQIDKNSFIDWARVGSLRISPDMDCKMQIVQAHNPSKAILVNGSTKFDLVDFMLQSRTANKNNDTEITDQRFLDLNKIWDLDFTIDPSTYAAISLTIQGWTMWFDDVNLGDKFGH